MNDPTLYERLMAVTGCQIAATRSMAVTGCPIAATLWKNYRDALTQYLNSCGCSNLHIPQLEYPHTFFYVRFSKGRSGKRKPEEVHSVWPFSYQNRGWSTRISENTFPYYVNYACGLPQDRSTELLLLYQCLRDYMLQYPYSNLDTLRQPISAHHPQFGFLLQNDNFIKVTAEGNLTANLYLLRAMEYWGRLPPQDIASLLELEYSNIPSRLVKAYFTEVWRAHREDPALYALNELQPEEDTLLYSISKKTFTVRYCFEQNCFEQEAQANTTVFGVKRMYAKLSSRQPVSDAVIRFFSTLCGNDLSLVDGFSCFLAKALSPVHAGMTVLCTQNHGTLLEDLLRKLFFAAGSGRGRVTLNKLTKQTQMYGLFLMQTHGAAVVFLQDVLPSEENLSKLKKLLKGKKPFAIKSNILPNQYFCNRLHFICITSDRKKADWLRKKLKADVLDFSYTESTEKAAPAFDTQDLQWLRTTMTLYGLKQLTLRKNGLEDPTPYQIPPSPRVSPEDFAEACCVAVSQSECSPQQLYDAYTDFFRQRCGDRPLPFTRITLNKRLQPLIRTRFHHAVEYKRPHHSRSASNGYRYVGLALRPAPPPPPMPPAMESFLRHMDESRVLTKWDEIPGIEGL